MIHDIVCYLIILSWMVNHNCHKKLETLDTLVKLISFFSFLSVLFYESKLVFFINFDKDYGSGKIFQEDARSEIGIIYYLKFQVSVSVLLLCSESCWLNKNFLCWSIAKVKVPCNVYAYQNISSVNKISFHFDLVCKIIDFNFHKLQKEGVIHLACYQHMLWHTTVTCHTVPLLHCWHRAPSTWSILDR